MKHFFFTIFFFLILAASPTAATAENIVMHEWGTFTALQDDSGAAIAGVNTDDEPVPSFVYDIGNSVVPARSELSPAFAARARMTKGSIPRLHPDVTLRLETPVAYFHLPKNMRTAKLDVGVAFNGGWLSQYYPLAVANMGQGDTMTGRITPETVGTLSWTALEIGTGGAGPKTDDAVWLAPRNVKAESLRTANGESEKFLFYRGLGNVASPLSAKHGAAGLELAGGDDITQIWHVDVRADGTVAYTGGKRSFAGFSEKDYSVARLADLKKEMHKALVREGLFADEAAAMLKTWDYSYFKAAGERVFYLVPQKWTDTVLPIKFSVPVDATRVMIGRIELVGARQSVALERMKNAAADDIQSFIEKSTKDIKDWQLYQEVSSGRKPVAVLGAEVPEMYKDYLQLGRFRDAILLDENARHPSASLARFIELNQIAMHVLPN